MVAHSAGSSVEQNGGKVFIQLRVSRLNQPPHIYRETHIQIVATISSCPFYKRVWLIFGQKESSLSLEILFLCPTTERRHQRIWLPIIVTKNQGRLNLVPISRYQSLQRISDHHKLEIIFQFIQSHFVCESFFQE